MHHEFAIDAVQDGLQVVPFPRILAVKQLQDVYHERLVNVFLSRLGVSVLTDYVPQQELIHYLHIRKKQTRSVLRHNWALSIQPVAFLPGVSNTCCARLTGRCLCYRQFM